MEYEFQNMAQSNDTSFFDLSLTTNYLESKYLFELFQNQFRTMNSSLIEESEKNEDEDEDEVTHETFFGENIKRAIKTFR
jgi:hypothetical protein